jgi:hypothetical protein
MSPQVLDLPLNRAQVKFDAVFQSADAGEFLEALP